MNEATEGEVHGACAMQLSNWTDSAASASMFGEISPLKP